MDTKNKQIRVEGIIIKEEPIKEYDKILTILTTNYGKINVYSFNSRRQKSSNISKTRLFCHSKFELRLINNKYNLVQSVLIDSFDELSNDTVNVIYGSYFLELLDAITFENIDAYEHIDNLTNALKALIKNKMDKNLIRRVFELRTLYIEGLYVVADDLPDSTNDTIKYTWNYIINNDINNIYNFNLKPEYNKQLSELVEFEFKNKIDKNFKSLKMLERL